MGRGPCAAGCLRRALPPLSRAACPAAAPVNGGFCAAAGAKAGSAAAAGAALDVLKRFCMCRAQGWRPNHLSQNSQSRPRCRPSVTAAAAQPREACTRRCRWARRCMSEHRRGAAQTACTASVAAGAQLGLGCRSDALRPCEVPQNLLRLLRRGVQTPNAAIAPIRRCHRNPLHKRTTL